MKNLFFSLCMIFWQTAAFAYTSTEQQTLGHTVNLYIKENRTATILYLPGCNGLDSYGKNYQRYHLGKLKEVWPDANIVVSQYVNDYTRGEKDGRCFWPNDDARLNNKQSWDQAVYTVNLANWIKSQPWSNGEVHLFGYSYGGRVGIWLLRNKLSHSVFESIGLIWPDCRPIPNLQPRMLKSKTRIWSTEGDPLSEVNNCPNYFVDPDKKLTITTYPGDTHSWIDGPFFKPFVIHWPNQNVTVRHEFNKEWADKTFIDWKKWAINNDK
jgi:dienelactone hydrolase